MYSNVNQFVSSSELILKIYLYITCSPMDPLQWMGAVRMRIQTADKNIHKYDSSPSINVVKWKAACL